MILKELDPFRGGPADVAARVAADRLAYHLRLHFRRSHQVDVLNELRLQAGQSMAEVDHLALHGHGLVAILRERRHGRLRVDDEGRWFQQVDGAWEPMASPITHAYVQALLVKSVMDRRVQQRGFFDQLEVDVLVVLEDDTVLEGEHIQELAEVCRREQVGERVQQRRIQCERSARRPAPLTEGERRTLGEFLLTLHRSARPAQVA